MNNLMKSTKSTDGIWNPHVRENASETVKLDEVPVKLSGLEIPLGAYARFGKKELR